jgi:hypothetical protein
MFFDVLKINKNYLDNKLIYGVVVMLGLLITIVIFNRFKSTTNTQQVETFVRFPNKPKSIININKDKLHEDPKTVSFSLNNDVMYFNERGFLRQEQERM